MSKLHFEVPNSLPIEEARRRLEALLAHWRTKYGVETKWEGDAVTMRGSAMGVSIDGGFRVFADRVAIEASDPGMLLRGQAKKYLTRKFAEYLDPDSDLDGLA